MDDVWLRKVVFIQVWGTGQRRVKCALGGVMYITYVKCAIQVRWCDSV